MSRWWPFRGRIAKRKRKKIDFEPVVDKNDYMLGGHYRREEILLNRKLSFVFEVEPVENGVIVIWSLDGKSKKKAGGPDDSEQHRIVCVNPEAPLTLHPMLEEILENVILATDALRKVLASKLK